MSTDNVLKRKGDEPVNEISKKQEVDENQKNALKPGKRRRKKKQNQQNQQNQQKNNAMKSNKDENSGPGFINKNMSLNRDKVNNKIIQMKLRVIDEDDEHAEDKVLSYLQMRSYLRALRRFKGLVYFYHGADEEHTYFNETNEKINHLYYDSNVPETIKKLLFKYMYIQKINDNKSKRDAKLNGESNMET